MERLNFGATIQISDILDIAHDVPGVDNVRLATPGDNVPYGVQEVLLDGVTTTKIQIFQFLIQLKRLSVHRIREDKWQHFQRYVLLELIFKQ
jgi:hypothetical protein